jgi:hypothetical protein
LGQNASLFLGTPATAPFRSAENRDPPHKPLLSTQITATFRPSHNPSSKAPLSGCVRKASLFAGSEEGAQTRAVLASLLQTARLNGLDPYTWLNDVLERIVSEKVKINELDSLLAWNWRPAHEPVKALAA